MSPPRDGEGKGGLAVDREKRKGHCFPPTTSVVLCCVVFMREKDKRVEGLGRECRRSHGSGLVKL